VSENRARGAMARCPGPCFALSPDGGTVTVACLAGELGRIRRGAGALRLAGEIGKGPAARPPAPPACRAGFAITAYGVRIGVRANEAGVLARIRDHLPPGWRSVRTREVERLYSFVVPRRRGIHTVYRDLSPFPQTLALKELLDTFESDLQLYVAERAARRVFVHAGVVGWRGRAILLPGPSMSGKSTLVAELVRAGATYYSDEYAVLDARGRVYPYARRLSLRADGTLERRRCSAAALGGRTGGRPLPVGLVAVSRYRPRARWRPRRLSVSAGALEIVAHTVAVRRDPRRALAAIEQVVRHAPILRGVRGEARETACALLHALGRGAG
jgi:hypothetical protein